MEKKSTKSRILAGAVIAGAITSLTATGAGVNSINTRILGEGFEIRSGLIDLNEISSKANIFEMKCGSTETTKKVTDKDKATEHKCGEGKCGETGSKKADAKTKNKNAKQVKAKDKTMEGKCGEGKCGEAKSKKAVSGKAVTTKDKAKDKSTEGKCGEGKCGVE